MIADSTTGTDLPVEAVGTLAAGVSAPAVFLGGICAVQIKRIKRRTVNQYDCNEFEPQNCAWIPMKELS